MFLLPPSLPTPAQYLTRGRLAPHMRIVIGRCVSKYVDELPEEKGGSVHYQEVVGEHTFYIC